MFRSPRYLPVASFTVIAFALMGCESTPMDGYFAPMPEATTTQVTPTAVPTPTQSAVVNGSNDGVGESKGSGGAGNVILYGDEWAARFGDDENDYPNWSTVVQPNLTNFWNDALGSLTANHTTKRVLLARFNDAATTWDVIAASSWRTYLPGLDAQFVLSDYNSTTDGPLTAELLSNYDALVFVSYDPMLTNELLTDYVQSGGSIMAMTIGFGVPGPDNSAANYECLNMNMILAGFPYEYQCDNPNSNFLANGIFSNINTASDALPFQNGYAVIPSAPVASPSPSE